MEFLDWKNTYSSFVKWMYITNISMQFSSFFLASQSLQRHYNHDKNGVHPCCIVFLFLCITFLTHIKEKWKLMLLLIFSKDICFNICTFLEVFSLSIIDFLSHNKITFIVVIIDILIFVPKPPLKIRVTSLSIQFSNISLWKFSKNCLFELKLGL